MSGPSTRPCGPDTCTSSKRPWRSCTQCSLRVRHITRPTDGMSLSSARQSEASGVAGPPDAQRDQLGFADAQRRGGIADAQRRLLAAQAGPAGGKVGIRGREHEDLLLQRRWKRTGISTQAATGRPPRMAGQEMPAAHGGERRAVEQAEAAAAPQHGSRRPSRRARGARAPRPRPAGRARRRAADRRRAWAECDSAAGLPIRCDSPGAVVACWVTAALPASGAVAACATLAGLRSRAGCGLWWRRLRRRDLRRFDRFQIR